MRGCLAAALAGAAVLGGCRPGERFPDLHPVEGTVTRAGRPVAGGGLIFLPDPPNGSGLVVNASVQPDGRFTVETSRTADRGTEIRPGAPAGAYKVVYHPPGNGQKTGLEVELPAGVTVPAGPVALALPDALPGGRGVPRDDDPDARRP